MQSLGQLGMARFHFSALPFFFGRITCLSHAFRHLLGKRQALALAFELFEQRLRTIDGSDHVTRGQRRADGRDPRDLAGSWKLQQRTRSGAHVSGTVEKAKDRGRRRGQHVHLRARRLLARQEERQQHRHDRDGGKHTERTEKNEGTPQASTNRRLLDRYGTPGGRRRGQNRTRRRPRRWRRREMRSRHRR